MIKRITDKNTIDKKMLEKSYYGRKTLSYLMAYGVKYDFCKFYSLEYEGMYGYIFHMNSSMVVCTEDDIPTEELCDFIEMNMPFRVEVSQSLLPKLNSLNKYQRLRRTLFEFSQERQSNINEEDIDDTPKLDDVYSILKEGFPNLLDYGLWLTDTSHRVRRGISKVYIYKNLTTATLIYDVKDTVLVGQVATRVIARGSGHAREFLHWLGSEMKKQGKTAILFALDVRKSFYEEIGFKDIMTEYVLERQDIEKESQQKGALR